MSAAAPTASNPITTPYTVDQLQALAQSEAAAQINATNAPLQAQVGTLGGQKTAAEQEINQMYGQLLPYVQQSAQAVQGAQENAATMAQQVFAAAGTRMNQLYQQQASEAQQLAQQIGGPVSAGQFTQGVEPYMAALPGEQGAGVLGALGSGLANTTEAQQFAGQVFPALNTEDVAKSDSYYNNQIKTLQDQIDANAATKSDLVGKTFNDLLQQERSFAQNQTQLQLDKQKAARDWKVQQQQIASSKLSGKLSQQAAKRAGITLQQRGTALRITAARTQAEIQHMSQADKIAAARLGLSKAEFVQRAQHQNQMAKVGAARVSDAISKDAASVVEAAMGGGKPVSRTYRDYIPKNTPQAALAKVGKVAGAYLDPKNGQYYKIAHETMTPAQWAQMSGQGGAATPIHDPNRLYDLVRGTIPQLGAKATVNLIRAQTGLKGWSPGKNMNYNGATLHAMSMGELYGVARDHGFPGKIGGKSGASRQNLIDWILHLPHNATGPGVNP